MHLGAGREAGTGLVLGRLPRGGSPRRTPDLPAAAAALCLLVDRVAFKHKHS